MGFDGRVPTGGESGWAFDLLARPVQGWPFAPSGLVPAFGLSPLPYFYAGVMLEGVALLTGCWLLARRLCSSLLSVFVVSVAATGSALWANDLWLNCRLVFAAPLLIHLAEEFLETGSRPAILGLASIGGAQAFGLPPGMAPVPLLAVLFWFLARTALFGFPLRQRLKGKGPMLLGAAVLLLVLLALGVLRGTPAEAHASIKADPLAGAGLCVPGRYLDLLVGAMPGTEFTSYCGFLTLGLASVGLVLLPRVTALRILAAFLGSLLLLGLGVWAFHALAPSLAPFRPVPFGGPWVRLFVVFLAGAGMDRVAGIADRSPLTRAAVALLVLAAGQAWLSGALVLQDRWPEDALASLEAVTPDLLPPWYSDAGLLSDALGASALFAALAGGVLLLASYPRTRPMAWALLLFVHPLDVFSWKFRMSWLGTSASEVAAPAVASAWLPPSRPPGPPSPLAPVASAVAALNAVIALALLGRFSLGVAGAFRRPEGLPEGRGP